MSYFVDIVLKSVGLPEKPSYTIPEVLQILGVTRGTLLAMIRDGRFPRPFHPELRERKFQEGGTPTKRFYKQALIDYFEQFASPLPPRQKETTQRQQNESRSTKKRCSRKT